MEKTPPQGQRLLFSATLDAAVDVLVHRYLTDPVTHRVDPEIAPVATMTHHLLHVREDERLPVLADLAAAPGRTLVFARTKHGAKRLTKQLNAAGVPSVELHGNLAQNARDRNLRAFTTGTARTLVATDIAARGIHVDNVTLVVHADPPAEHKAYLHRSGRTARAGAGGTVITLMTDDQVTDVAVLVRRAGISATTTRLRPGNPLLHRLAPGQRTYEVIEPGQCTVEVDSPDRISRTRTGRPRHGSAQAASSTADADRARAGRPPRSQGTSDRGIGGRANRHRGGAVSATRATVPATDATQPARLGGAAAFSSSTRIGRRAR
jgi:superfamily II DNA/RNA helicase